MVMESKVMYLRMPSFIFNFIYSQNLNPHRMKQEHQRQRTVYA